MTIWNSWEIYVIAAFFAIMWGGFTWAWISDELLPPRRASRIPPKTLR